MHVYSPVILNPSIVSQESCIFCASAFENPSLLYTQSSQSRKYLRNPSLSHWKNTHTHPINHQIGNSYRTWYTCSTNQVMYNTCWCGWIRVSIYIMSCTYMYTIFGIYHTHGESGVRRIPVWAKVCFSFVYTLGCTADVHTIKEPISVLWISLFPRSPHLQSTP